MKSLKTGLKILSEFSHVTGELTVTELSVRLGIGKSQVSRMLAAFREEGWIVQNPKTRGFSIGISAYAAGARFINSNRLTSEALPVMRSVVDRCGFTTTLSVLEGTRPLYLLGIDGSISVDFASQVGAFFPFHATAPGKLLAAFADETVLSEMLDPSVSSLQSLTPRTIVEVPNIRRELRMIRGQGVSISTGERAAGVGAMAVPVFDSSGSSVAAMGISYPEGLVQANEYASYASILHKAASTLSLRLGAETYPFRFNELAAVKGAAMGLALTSRQPVKGA